MPWITRYIDKEALQKLKLGDIKLTDEFKLGLEHMVYQTEKLQLLAVTCYELFLSWTGRRDKGRLIAQVTTACADRRQVIRIHGSHRHLAGEK